MEVNLILLFNKLNDTKMPHSLDPSIGNTIQDIDV